jgi:hypothetical protein
LVTDKTTNFVGISLDSLARLRRGQIQLTSKLAFTEAITNAANQVLIQTNIAARMRVWFPPGGGVFQVSETTNRPRTAVLLSATLQ